MRLVFCNLLGLLILLATPSVTPDPHLKTPKDSNLKTHLLHSSPQRSLQDRHTSHDGTMTAHLPLSKRAHSLRIDHIQVHSMTVPVMQAASALSMFYAIVLQECASKWAHLPPLYVMRITNGFFALELYSSTGPVPWALVAEVASNMLAVTARGFTGTYDIWYEDKRIMTMGIGVLVKFRIWNPNVRAGLVVIDTPQGRIPV